MNLSVGMGRQQGRVMIRIGDPVMIVRDGIDYNPHIRQKIGEVAVVTDVIYSSNGEGDFVVAVDIETFSGGIGTLDAQCVTVINNMGVLTQDERDFLYCKMS